MTRSRVGMRTGSRDNHTLGLRGDGARRALRIAQHMGIASDSDPCMTIPVSGTDVNLVRHVSKERVSRRDGNIAPPSPVTGRAIADMAKRRDEQYGRGVDALVAGAANAWDFEHIGVRCALPIVQYTSVAPDSDPWMPVPVSRVDTNPSSMREPYRW